MVRSSMEVGEPLTELHFGFPSLPPAAPCTFLGSFDRQVLLPGIWLLIIRCSFAVEDTLLTTWRREVWIHVLFDDQDLAVMGPQYTAYDGQPISSIPETPR